MTLDNLLTTRELYEADYAERFSWGVFQVRLHQLRKGRASIGQPPQLTPETHWRKVGTTVFITQLGRNRIARLLNLAPADAP